MDRTPRLLLFPMVLALGVLAACGDDDDNGGPTAAAFTVRLATLNGAQEAPAPVTTDAFGAGALAVDESSGRVRGFVVTSGTPTANQAHVHLAARGTPGNVIVPLTGGPDLWVVPDNAAALSRAQIDAFLAGNLYFNVHTPANATGEIRGQLDKPGTVRLASLDGAQERPDPVTTDASGAGMLSVDTSGAVRGFVVAAGTPTANQAHVHLAPRGTAAGVIVPLTGGPSLWVVPDDAPALTAEQRDAFTAGNLYLNVHTPANPTGEIRGQLDRPGAVRLTTLTGTQEAPSPITTSAFGAGALSVDGASGAVNGFIVASGLPTANNAHVHEAARGTPGDVRVPLGGAGNLWVVPDDAGAIAQPLRAAFTAGNLYLNAHTPANPTGEIRGQLD